ncbi:MFS transporter [Nocardiopsis coralliicola]
MNNHEDSTHTAPTPAPRTPHASPILTLAGFVLLVFCTGTAEYLVAGVLPQMAGDLSVTIATAGQAVTAYALGVAIGGPIVTALTARLPRKGLALSLGAVFVAGILVTVLAPSYPWVMVGRVVSASSQATLFAIGLMTAAAALGPARQGRAVAIVASGLTVATVMGVPLGALLGGNTDWRLPFAIVAAAAVLGVALLARAMPRTPAPATGVRDELRTLLRGPVLLAVATTVIGFAGVSVVFTYLVPLLTRETGIAAGVVPALLLAYGAGGFAGNLIAGRLADLSLGGTLAGVFTALVLTLAAFPLAAGDPVPMVGLVLVLGLLSTATIAPLQSLVLRHAGAAPTLSLAVNVGAFNLANAIGAALGGLGVAAGLLRWGGFGGAAFAVLGLLLAVLAVRLPVSGAPRDTGRRREAATEDAVGG